MFGVRLGLSATYQHVTNDKDVLAPDDDVNVTGDFPMLGVAWVGVREGAFGRNVQATRHRAMTGE